VIDENLYNRVATLYKGSNKLEPPVVEGGFYGSYGPFDQNGGRRPQPIHGQTDAVLSELYLKRLPKKQSFGRY
jgi:hypothetical protein